MKLQNKIIDFHLWFQDWNHRLAYGFMLLFFLVTGILSFFIPHGNVQLGMYFLGCFEILLLNCLAYYILTSLRLFLLAATAYNFIFSYGVTQIAGYYFHLSNRNMDFFLIFVTALVWICISLIANSNVAITANTIVSGVFGIVIIIYNLFSPIAAALSSDSNIPTKIVFWGKTVILTAQQADDFSFNLLTVPVLLSTGISAIVCSVKKYWIDKYHEGKEITWEEPTSKQ